MKIRVAVCGALGRMGREVVKAVESAEDLILVGGVDRLATEGTDIGAAVGIGQHGARLVTQIDDLLAPADVLVDFTQPGSALPNTIKALHKGMHVVVGTTGLSQKDLKEINEEAQTAGRGVIVAPNFAIGAVLMMRFAAQAARFFPNVEIIELHHDQKKDAPSGTALKTAEMIQCTRNTSTQAAESENVELVSGARGGTFSGIHIHSVRLPGLVAHQEVIFGLPGQTLTVRHDSTSRESFMPGVLLAIREVVNRQGLIYGLENLLEI